MKVFNPLKIWLFFALLSFTVYAAESHLPLADNVITTHIKTKIAQNPQLSVFNIDITTNGGVVTLAGIVDSSKQASTLIELVQSVADVKDVEVSGLTIKERDQPFSDMVITAKVKGMFIQKSLFDPHQSNGAKNAIIVSTKNGVVYLSGTIDSYQRLMDAISFAEQVNGVQGVVSQIKRFDN